MDELILQVLNDWAVYSKYNREQTCFSLNSLEYEFHQINKRVEYLLSEYDESGVLSIIAIKQAYKKILKDLNVNLFDFFSKFEETNKEINEHFEMYKKLYDKEIVAYENEYYQRIGLLIQKVLGKPLLGDSNNDEFSAMLGAYTDTVLEGLKKCHLNVYKKGGTVGKITKIATQIYIFPSIAECLLALENADDGMYLTYINVQSSPDSFFGFFVKSNGNLFSFDERIPEAYRGSHQYSRNGRWTEEKADDIFPYEYIFNYSDYDYKGYSKTYQIDEEKLAFLNLEPKVYIPLLLAMVFVVKKFSEKELEKDVVYLDSMLPQNLPVLTEDSTELMVIQKTELATMHQNLNLRFDLDKVLSGEYCKEFKDMGRMTSNNLGQMFVEMYGDGFSFDVNDVIKIPDVKLLTDKREEYLPEFVGSEAGQRMQIFYEIRQKLADYIRGKMKEEYEAFGGVSAYRKWYENAVKQNLKSIEEIFVQRYNEQNLQKVGWGSTNPNELFNVYLEKDVKYPSTFGSYKVNQTDEYKGTFADLRTGNKCSIFVTFKPKNYKGIQQLVGKIPKLVKGWNSEGHMTYGNSILDVTDAVEAVGTPFESWECEKYRKDGRSSFYSFQFCIGYSKRGFNQMLKEFTKK